MATYSLMIGPDHPVPVSPQGGMMTITVDQTGGTVYYAESPTVSISSAEGSIPPGAQQTFTTLVWLLASRTAGVQAQVTSVYDQWAATSPGGGGGGSGSSTPNVVQAGNLGTTYSHALSATQDTWIVGTLNANCAVTLTGLVSGTRGLLLLTQDATGGRTLSVNGASVSIPAAATASMVISCADDGTNLYVSLIGGSGTPTGTAGGDLSGSYPNPTVAKVNGVAADAVTTKGDLLASNATPALKRIGVGSDGQVLTADSTQTLGVKWATPGGAAAGPVIYVTGGIGFVNSWTDDLTNITQKVGYYKDSLGIVHLTGAAKNGSAAPSDAFTLPTGYRPGNSLYFPSINSNTALGIGRVTISAAGVVNLYPGGGTAANGATLEGITFLAGA